jgi:hypothetical protein
MYVVLWAFTFADIDCDSVLPSAYRQPVVYNLSVARELLKQVYVAERLQPPSDLAVLRNAYSTLWSRASSPAYWRGILNSGEWAKVGIYAVEAYGIFKVRLTPVYSIPVIDLSTDWGDSWSEKPCRIQRPVATAYLSAKHVITLYTDSYCIDISFLHQFHAAPRPVNFHNRWWYITPN